MLMRELALMTCLAACGARTEIVEVPVEPDRCLVKDPGPRPLLSWQKWTMPDGDTLYGVPEGEAAVLYVWTRDVDRLREALVTCPSVIMEPYQ